MDLRKKKSALEDKVNGGLDDGRIVGWTGVQVERVEKGVVPCCEGNNKEGACDMLCEDEVFL